MSTVSRAAAKAKKMYLYSAGYKAASSKVRGKEGRPVHIDDRRIWEAGRAAAQAGKGMRDGYNQLGQSERSGLTIEQLDAIDEANDRVDAMTDDEIQSEMDASYDETHGDDDGDDADMDEALSDVADFDEADDDEADCDDADCDDADHDEADDDIPF